MATTSLRVKTTRQWKFTLTDWLADWVVDNLTILIILPMALLSPGEHPPNNKMATILINRAFSLTGPASMQIYWNKRKHLHKKRVQLPQDLFGTPTWPPFYCFRTPIWPPWRYVKTLYSFYHYTCTIVLSFFCIAEVDHFAADAHAAVGYDSWSQERIEWTEEGRMKE